MCLIVFAWRRHPDYPLVLAANRDEFHARDAEPMAWWADKPSLLAGRDLKAGGTWLAVARNGRFATVTNYREDSATPDAGARPRSRGEIVTQFVDGAAAGDEFVESLDGAAYAGFSVLLADRERMVYGSNRGDPLAILEPGVYGLSNASLDTPWPKLVRTRTALLDVLAGELIDHDSLFDIIADRKPADDAESRSADLPFEMGRAVSAPFIVTPDYGTRCSTALLCRADGHVEIAERRFDAAGQLTGESRFVFRADPTSADAEHP